MKASKTILLIAAIFLISVSTAMATGPSMHRHQPGPPPDGPREPHGPAFWKSPEIIEKLQLTDAQIESLENLDFGMKEKMLDLKGDAEKGQLHLEKAFSKDEIDPDVIEKIAKDLSQVQEEIFLLHIDHRLAMMQLLTTEQRKLLPPPPHSRR